MTQTVTLRRAAKIRNRLQSRLQEVTREIESPVGRFNIHDPDFLDQVRAASEKYQSLLAQYDAISTTMESLRIKIGQANDASGVTALLARQAATAGRLATYSRVAKSPAAPTEEQIRARNEAARAASTSAYSSGNDVAMYSVVSSELTESAQQRVNTLQLNLDRLQESLESINTNATVELNDAELAVLQFERLI